MKNLSQYVSENLGYVHVTLKHSMTESIVNIGCQKCQLDNVLKNFSEQWVLSDDIHIKTNISEMLTQYEALDVNEIFYASDIIEQLILDSKEAKELTEASWKDMMKKIGFDISDEIEKSLNQKNKLWKLNMSDSEIDELVKIGKKDSFKGAYKVQNNKMVYIDSDELVKSKMVIPGHYTSIS